MAIKLLFSDIIDEGGVDVKYLVILSASLKEEEKKCWSCLCVALPHVSLSLVGVYLRMERLSLVGRELQNSWKQNSKDSEIDLAMGLMLENLKKEIGLDG